MTTPRTVAALVAGAALTLGAAAPSHATILPDPRPRLAEDAPTTQGVPVRQQRAPERAVAPARPVKVVDALTHLRALQRIANAHDGDRATGTSGYEASARYVEAALTAAGLAPSRHYFPFTYEETRSSSLTYTVHQRTSAAGHTPMGQSPGTPQAGVTGLVVVPTGSPTGCTAADWADADAAGAIALVARGTCTFAQKASTAADAGAVALVVHNTTAGSLVGSLGGHPDDHLPAVGVTQETGRVLASLPDDALLTVTLDKIVEERQGFSIVAETGTHEDGRGVAVLGGHLDSGEEGPGINDNGSGSAALLEAAARLSAGDPPTSTVRFAWWGGSDLGNLGSRGYLADLAAEDPQALENIEVYVDVDTVGSPNHVVAVQDPEGAGSVLTDHLDSVGEPWIEGVASSDSDAQAFIEQGVASTGLTTGTSRTKTTAEARVFGGTAGVPHDPNNGTVADTLANVDPDVLQTTTAAVVHAAETLASRR